MRAAPENERAYPLCNECSGCGSSQAEPEEPNGDHIERDIGGGSSSSGNKRCDRVSCAKERGREPYMGDA